jgi:Cu(I)/Ag(I) efflux system membrane fusion protein
MKKFLYAIFFVLVIIVSFLAGSWYSHRGNEKGDPSDVKSSAVVASDRENTETTTHPQTDTVTDTDTDTDTRTGTVKISPEKQQLIGIQVAIVEKKPVTHSLRILGRVAVDELRVYIINTAAAGWVRNVSSVTVGSVVRKGQRLATFYSPEFLSSQQAYFYALNALDRFMKEDPPNLAQIRLTKANIQQYADSLRSLGMGEMQIEELSHTRTLTDQIEMTSPTSGICVARNLYPGQRFEKATEFYKIADLSHVWILADVYENEGKYLKPGVKAKATLPSRAKTYDAIVSDIVPQFDPSTRTLKVRLEADNPGYILWPDMFVDIEIPVNLPPAVTVPADAVLDSGLKKTVFIDLGNGFFEPREVETGWRMGNRVEITKGLKPGERIVVSGNFLIDSESRLELAAQGMLGTLSKDPVCGVDVSINKAEKTGRKSTYQGKTYYFTSDECKQQFDKNPAHYVER